MIDQKELRLGCWYNLKNPMNGELVPTEFSNWTEVLEFEAYGEPIPLTIVGLERCGFIDPAGNGMAYRIDILSGHELCWYRQDSYLRYQSKLSGFTSALLHIKHLHQLQNLFYALTGKELTIKSINQSN